MKKSNKTKIIKTFISASLFLSGGLFASFAQAANDLKGWTKSGFIESKYRAGFEHLETPTGDKEVAYLKAHRANYKTYGSLTKTIDAERLRGKRIQLLTQIKLIKADNAGAFVKIDGKEQTLKLDNMANRRLWGTKNWRPISIVIDVPKEAETVSFGFILKGNGTAWYEEPVLQFVDQSVKTTDHIFNPNVKPLEMADYRTNRGHSTGSRRTSEVADADVTAGNAVNNGGP